MKLSIITTNFNNLNGLKKTSESVVSLHYNDYEWIIIDGGSTDGSKEYIESISRETDALSYWCSEIDNGVYNAMNKGIKVAKGEYLIFMNSGDCFYSPDVLKKIFSKQHTGDIIYGSALYIFKDHEDLATVPSKVTFRFIYEYTIYHQASFIKRELLKDNGYDENLKIVSDWKMWLVWLLQNKIFEYVPEIICRFDAYGISTGHDDRLVQERDIVFREVLPLGIREMMDEIYSYEAILPYYPELFVTVNRKRCYKKVVRASLRLVKLIDWLRKKIGI